MKALSCFTSSLMKRYFLLVAVPTLVALLYLGVFASDGYVSRAQVIVQQDASLAAAGAELALGLLSVGGGKSKQDALLVQDFMRSRTMLDYLDRELNLRAHFSSADVDPLSRLDPEAPAEEFLEYFRDHLIVSIDNDSLILEVEFFAFDPVFAQDVGQKLIERSETFVNDVSQKLAQGQLAFVEKEAEKANERVKQATRAMIALQRRTEVLDPQQEAEAMAQILAELEIELAKQRTQIKAMSGYLNSTAPDMVAARQRIAALEEQLEQERDRLVGTSSKGLNDLMLTFQDAQVEARLAAEVYKTALATLESTRLDAVRKVKYLISIDTPNLPDSAEMPRVLYWTVTIFAFLNLIYFVGGLIVATIQDHRE